MINLQLLAEVAEQLADDELAHLERVHNRLYSFTEGREILMKKFAELIVRECLCIVKSNTYGPAGEYDYSYSDENYAADERAENIYKDITHHFGVEE
jgi:hypothetical protein